MKENYQKYSIDLHLKRYTKALQHIALCGALSSVLFIFPSGIS
jgi:hypothetical protein